MSVTNPTPQRQLRGYRPPRPTERAAVDAHHLAALAPRLTPRDRWLIRMLHEHRVLTSTQITHLAFGAARSANMRLLELYRWRVVDRFQPFVTTGTRPMHYVLDVAGAAILAAEHGTTAKELGFRHDRVIAISHSLRLAHTVAVNDVFSSLVAIARHSGDHNDSTGSRALTAWWSEARCGRYFGEHVRPDGYGRWREHNGTDSHEVEFFLEYDFGTEALSKVAAKLADYQQLATSSGIATPVLFWFPTAARETAARAALTAAITAARVPRPPASSRWLVPVATTATDLTVHPAHGFRADVPDSPAGARWLPLHTADTQAEQRRLRLAHLAPLRSVLQGRGTAAAPANAGQTTSESSAVELPNLPAPHPMPPPASTYWPNGRERDRAETA